MVMFMIEDFLFKNDIVCMLYYKYVVFMLIYDFYCYLSLQEIVDDCCFDNFGQIWLEGDYYKW